MADVRVLGGRAGVDVRRALEVLAGDYKVRLAVCEGGAALFAGFIRHGLVSRIHVTWAPLIFGGAAAPTLLGPAAESLLPRSMGLRLEEFRAVGGEAYATYAVRRGRPAR
jgi:riboflavin biosynthesis pyrimidine reductase